MLISIPPYLKGKSSIWIAQNVERKPRNFLSQILGEGVVSTVGRNEEMIRAYIRNQEMAGVGSAAIEARVLMKSHLSSQNPL
jgi:REP-associated tyrosine transposase